MAARSHLKRSIDAFWVALLFYVLILLLMLNGLKRIMDPFLRFFLSSRQPMVKRTPESRFNAITKEFRFRSNYLSVPMGGNQVLPRMHYLDESAANKGNHLTILLLHGEPTWCFLYRHMIPHFVKSGYRVIAPDFVGFGKSDKYTCEANCTFEMHCFALRKLIEHLDLANILLVGQDWGGIVGSVVASQMSDRFCALVLMNTGLPAPLLRADPLDRRPTLERLRGGAPFLVWRLFVSLVGPRLPVRFVFHKLMGLKAKIADAYNAPFPDHSYKTGAAVWPLLVPLFPDDPLASRLAEARAFLKMWRKPALIMSGDNDPITRDQAPILARLMPDAERRVVRGAGHFLQETHPNEVAKNILHFIKNAVHKEGRQEQVRLQDGQGRQLGDGGEQQQQEQEVLRDAGDDAREEGDDELQRDQRQQQQGGQHDEQEDGQQQDGCGGSDSSLLLDVVNQALDDSGANREESN